MDGIHIARDCEDAFALVSEAAAENSDAAVFQAINVPKELPDALRTHHWYNDLHHAMFLILFVNAFAAMRKSSEATVENYVDNITVYLFVHFLMEEEGMVYAVHNHGLDGDFVASHTEIHVNFMRWWNENIFGPFKVGGMDRALLHNKKVEFCENLIAHIDGVDVKTYGHEQRAEAVSRNEISHMSKCGLPLSPFMPGAYAIMEIVAPDMARMIKRKSLSPKAYDPLPPMKLMEPDMRLWKADRGAFRDALLNGLKGGRTGTMAAE